MTLGNKQEQSRRQRWLDNAGMILEALPYMQRYQGEYVVVKYGGNAMDDGEEGKKFISSILLLHQCGVRVVLVHGGGPEIEKMLLRLGLQSRFEQGLRYSDAATVEVAEMVLSGSINKRLVSMLEQGGVSAVGISGKDGGLVRAKKLKLQGVDLGFVGEVEQVDTRLLQVLGDKGMIPVVAPLASGADGDTYNINGDTMAGSIARSLCAKRLLMMTNVAGVKNSGGDIIWELSLREAQNLIKAGVIAGGMLPKVRTCLDAVQNGGVEAAVILDGRSPQSMLLELYTDIGGGTLIRDGL